MADNVKTKSVNSVLPYGWNWADWLSEGETIASYVITVSPSGTLAIDSDTTTSGCVLATISGGTSGSRYDILCKIITSASYVDERTLKIDVTQR